MHMMFRAINGSCEKNQCQLFEVDVFIYLYEPLIFQEQTDPPPKTIQA
jgi:hypothetical protein